MRDIAVTLAVFGSLFLILWRPYMGILVWSWLSYMNPHRLAWGFAYDMPFAQIVAITLFVSLLFHTGSMKVRITPTIVLMLVFVAWMIVTTFVAIYPELAQIQLSKVLKIQLLTFLTLVLITTTERLNQLIWVIVLSIGFYSIKGGVFTLLTAGAFHVYGPGGSDIEENNALALATLMMIPLMFYLYQLHRDNPYLRRGIAAGIVLSFLSALGSQSRGALIAIVAVGFFFWMKSQRKFVSGLSIVVFAVLLYGFMPQSWHDRMDTIGNYQEDSSAMSRIYAWKFSINIASDRLTGGGFNSWSKELYARYSPDATSNYVAHSIYFNVLADHGWIGLSLFLLILLATWRSLSKVITGSTPIQASHDQVYLAKMLQVSLVAYLSGGAFLSLSYFDLPWHIIAIAIIVSIQLQRTEGHSHNGHRGQLRAEKFSV